MVTQMFKITLEFLATYIFGSEGPAEAFKGTPLHPLSKRILTYLPVRCRAGQHKFFPDLLLRQACSAGTAYTGTDLFPFTSRADYPDDSDIAEYHLGLSCLRCCDAASNVRKTGPYVSLTDLIPPTYQAL